MMELESGKRLMLDIIKKGITIGEYGYRTLQGFYHKSIKK